MIQKMSKIQIIGSRRIMEEVIELLHSLSVLHIENIPEDGRRDIFYHIVPMQKEEIILKERAEKILQKVRDIILLLYRPSQLAAVSEGRFSVTEIASEKLLLDIEKLGAKLRNLYKRKSELKEELSLLERYERILKNLAPLISKLSGLKSIESIGIILDKDKAEVISILEREIQRITYGYYQIFKRELDDKSIGVILTYQKDYDKNVRALLSEEGVSEIRLPTEYSDLSFFDALKQMVKKNDEFAIEMSDIEKEIERLSDEWYWRIKAIEDIFKDISDEFKTFSYCTGTRYTFCILGWIPQAYLPQMRDSVKMRFGERVMVKELEIGEEELEMVPVYIQNPKIIKPFEVFLRILPPPRYDSVDPTPFIAIFFPVFFGLIVGDVGHGLIFLFLAVILKRIFTDKPLIQDLTKVFLLCAIYAIIFGILFGELFGEIGEKFGMHPIFLNRSKAIKEFLIFTVAIGVGHVMLGFIISLINSIKWRRGREIIGKTTSIVMLFTILLLIAELSTYLPKRFLNTGIIILIVSFPILVLSEGLIGVIELTKSIGNILSYVRIMALGIASVMMTLVANRLGEMIGNIVLGIIVAGLIHVLNIAIGIFSPTIQSLRLHYVEFFSKFYKTGDRRYTPFKKKREGVRLWRRL